MRGFRVTVFEQNAQAGGMLRNGIPAYRLPRDVLDREIEALLDERVTLELGVRLGSDVTVEKLLADTTLMRQMLQAGGDMGILAGRIRPLVEGERDADKLTQDMGENGQKLMVDILEELLKLEAN